MIPSRTTVAVVVAIFASLAFGQAAKPKPAPQKPATGAVQMPGENAKIGTPYKLGKKGEELHFTLEKAEFSTRFLTVDNAHCAPPGKRFLVMSFAVQNPHKTDFHFFEQSFKFTVVSPDDENFEMDGFAYHPDRRDSLNLQLKPVQKVRAIAFVPIHPQGPVNKLIIERGKGNPVLRYDLRKLVVPLKNAFSTAEGLGSLDEGVGLVKVPFELGAWDVTVESIGDSEPISGAEPGDGQRSVVAVLAIRNAAMIPMGMHSSIIVGKLFDEDGSESPMQYMYQNAAPESFNANIAKGAIARVRLLFLVPAAAKLDRLVLSEQLSERSVVVSAKPGG